MLARQPHQGQMGFVQIAHGRDESHPQLSTQLVAQGFDGVDDFQGEFSGTPAKDQAERVYDSLTYSGA